MSRPELERLLLEGSILSAEELSVAGAHASSSGMTLETAIVALGSAEERDVYKCVAKAHGLPFGDPAKATKDAMDLLPPEQIEQNAALPLLVKDGTLYVAIDDPMKTFVADQLSFIAGCEVRCAISPPGALRKALRAAVGVGVGGEADLGVVARGGASKGSDDDDAPIIRLVHKSVEDALQARASDIHIEPFEHTIRIRQRIDGVLRNVAEIPSDLHASLTSRIKIMANLDIAEKRKPQDGRIAFPSESGRQIDIRTSVLPGSHGETIVMRLLDKEMNLLSLANLGFGVEDQERFQRIIKRPNGVFLVTGPTGSGKTTTLYAALKQLNRPDVKIITAEDPVEFNIAGINQCQVRAGIGLTFARILRSMLRQAPNIILVGEIRDRETAEIAVQAALTGHLVFATLHTNDAPSGITRLVDIGVKPFLVSAAVQSILAQRLVRVLCKKCREAYQPTTVEMSSLGLVDQLDEDLVFYRSVGCPACDHVGYRGRLGLFELLTLDSTLREMTFKGETTSAIRRCAQTTGGMSTLIEDGARKVVDGTTSVDEILRVTSSMD